MSVENLVNFYKTEYEPKIFFERLIDDQIPAYILYVYNYEHEFAYFRDTFLMYLPFYIRNVDILNSIYEDENLEKQLIQRSKSIRRDSNHVVQRQMESDGLYGELFLDFYLRIVQKRRSFITYAQRKPYGTNQELKGSDNVVYYIDSTNKINLCFCESKFVTDASSAKTDLLEDINGKDSNPGHISKSYLNDYISFIVGKNPSIYEEDKEKFKTLIRDLNDELYAGKDFLSIIKKHNIYITFVFFAIFKSTKRMVSKLEQHYKDIYCNCIEKVKELGVCNYDVEIIFIPTNNKSMEIKRNIEVSYE